MLGNRISLARLLLLVIFVVGIVIVSGLWLTRNVSAFPDQFLPSVSQGHKWFQAPGNCLQLEPDAILYNAEDTWIIELALSIANVNLVPDDDFDLFWRDETGKQWLLLRKANDSDQDRPVQRLPPVRVDFVFDIDQAAMYASPFLADEDPIRLEEHQRQEKDFWNTLCDALVQQFNFEGKQFTDLGMVYGGKDGGPMPTGKEYTQYANGVFNALFQAIQQSYLDGSQIGDLSIIMKDDEWLKEFGEKVIVIIRWRFEPLSLDSYSSLRRPLFRDKTYLLVIDRASSYPQGWENLENSFQQYGIQLAYVPAPPAYSQTSQVVHDRLQEAFNRLQSSIHRNRQRIRIRFRFPYLLDRFTIDNGRLQVIHANSICSSGEIALSPVSRQDPPPRLSLAIVISTWVTAVLLVIQASFLAGIVAYKNFAWVREKVQELHCAGESNQEGH